MSDTAVERIKKILSQKTEMVWINPGEGLQSQPASVIYITPSSLEMISREIGWELVSSDYLDRMKFVDEEE